MKSVKFLCGLLAVIGFASRVWSQEFRINPSLGFNIGLNPIRQKGYETVAGTSIRPGLDIGVNAELMMTKKLSLQAGWLYTINNGKVERIFFSLVSPGPADDPSTREKYSIHFIRTPVNLLFKQDKPNAFFWGFGPELKFSLNSSRDGKIVDREETYSTKFKLDTKNGGHTGLGFLVSAGKELSLGKNAKGSIRLNFDADITDWRYPTNFEYEEVKYFSFRNYNFSLLFSWLLSTRSKK